MLAQCKTLLWFPILGMYVGLFFFNLLNINGKEADFWRSECYERSNPSSDDPDDIREDYEAEACNEKMHEALDDLRKLRKSRRNYMRKHGIRDESAQDGK